MIALWTNNPPPPEYIDLLLMRDVFHCTPSALYEQDAADIVRIMAVLEAEAIINKRNQQT